MSYVVALGAVALGAEGKIGAQLELQLSTDLAKRFEQGDWSMDKQGFESYAKGAGVIAGAAACTAAGLAIAAPICGTVGGAVVGFLTTTVWGALSDWLGSDDEERLAAQLLLQTQNELKVGGLYVQMFSAVQRAQNTLAKLASDLGLTEIKWELSKSGALTPAHPPNSRYATIKLGGHLKPEDMITQLRLEGLPKGEGTLGVPDWPKMLASRFYTVPTIYLDAQSYLKKLQKAGAKVASKLVGAAAAKKAFAQKIEQQSQQESQQKKGEAQAAASASAVGWTIAGLVGVGGLWWWLGRKKKSRRR